MAKRLVVVLDQDRLITPTAMAAALALAAKKVMFTAEDVRRLLAQHAFRAESVIDLFVRGERE